MTITRRRLLAQSGVAAAFAAAPAVVRAAPRSVIVIGAGAAGLTAADRLIRRGIEVRVLEAAPVMGGRIRRLRGFADFPIDLGGEWIHTDPKNLRHICQGKSRGLRVIEYAPQTFSRWTGDRLRRSNWLRRVYSEHKFQGTTWYGFFDAFVAPLVRPSLELNAPVTHVDTSGATARVTLADGRVAEADAVLCIVPVTILQQGRIRFTPELPGDVQDGLRSIVMGDGLKVFMKFSDRFYPDMLLFDTLFELGTSEIYKTYYDAAYGKHSNDNVLGLFAVGHRATPFVSLPDDQLIDRVIAELDMIFDGQASRHLMGHAIQNWSAEPWIRGSYSTDWEVDPSETLAPREGRLFFAGEAMGGDDQATVHGAALSGVDAAQMIRDS